MSEQANATASASEGEDNVLPAAAEEESQDSGGSWIMTYADLVTLLFAFFVLLFAMSSTQQESFKELIQSLRSALGVQQVPEAGTREGLTMHEIPTSEKKPEAVDEAGGMVQKEIDEISSEVRELIMFNRLGGRVKVTSDDVGATITLADLLLFPAGATRMSEEGLAVMKKIYHILSQFSYRIKIAGHTDNIPIHTAKYASNWELSANRACDVVRFLIDQGIDPQNISAVGYADNHPVATNDTPEGRAQNRRVEIIYERQAITEKILSQL